MFLAVLILPYPISCQAEEGGILQKIEKYVTPTHQYELFIEVKHSPALKHKENGSIWEPDITQHGGSTWKRWNNKRDWEKRRTPQSIMPNGKIRKNVNEQETS